MASAPGIIINLPGYPFNNLQSVASIDLLRAIASGIFTDGQDISVDYGLTPGDGLGGIFAWAPSSTANDDGISVIRPDDVAPLAGGRWLATSAKVANSLGTQTNVAPSQNAITTGFAASDGTTLVGHDPLGQSAAITTKGFLDRFGYNASDATGWQQANDLIVAGGDRRKLLLDPLGTYTLTGTTGLNLDLSFLDLDGRKIKVDASGMTGGRALSVTASGAFPQDNLQNGLSDIQLLGPGVGSAVTGVYVGQPIVAGSAAAAAHMESRNLYIRGFGVGLQLGENCYLHSFYNPAIEECGVGLDVLTAVNGGENIRLFGGTIADGGMAFRCANANADINVFGTSLDYNQQIAVMTAGRLLLNAPHVELRGGDDGTGAAGTVLRQFILSGDGTHVHWQGGERLLAGAMPHTFDIWAEIGSTASFYDAPAFVNNDRTSSGIFSTGDGLIERGSIQGYNFNNCCYLLHDVRSRAVDPGFTDATVPDNIFFNAPGGAYTLPTRLSISHTTSGPVATLATGGGALKFVKTLGAGFSSTFSLAYPLTPGEMLGGHLFYAKPGALTGTMFVSISWARLDGHNPLNPLVPLVAAAQSIGTLAVVFSSAAVAATEFAAIPQTSLKPPHWATHAVISFNCDGLSAGEVDITAPNFDRMM